MKKNILIISSFIFLTAILFSFSSPTFNHQDFAYQLIKTEKLTEFKLLSFASKIDTILVVSKNDVSLKCIKENLILITLQNNNKIYELNDAGKKIIFEYYTKGGENENLRILTSSEKPGSSSRRIFSYNSLPYFVEKCSLRK